MSVLTLLSSTALARVGDLFDMLLPMLSIYQEYVRNHHYSLQVLTECKSNPNFATVLKRLEGEFALGTAISVYAYDGAVVVEIKFHTLESNHHHFRLSISHTFASNFGRLHSQTTMSGSKPRDIPNISNASDTALYHYSAWALGSHTTRSCREEELTERSTAARGSQQVSWRATFATYAAFNAKRKVMLSSRVWKFLRLFFSPDKCTTKSQKLKICVKISPWSGWLSKDVTFCWMLIKCLCVKAAWFRCRQAEVGWEVV